MISQYRRYQNYRINKETQRIEEIENEWQAKDAWSLIQSNELEGESFIWVAIVKGSASQPAGSIQNRLAGWLAVANYTVVCLPEQPIWHGCTKMGCKMKKIFNFLFIKCFQDLFVSKDSTHSREKKRGEEVEEEENLFIVGPIGQSVAVIQWHQLSVAIWNTRRMKTSKLFFFFPLKFTWRRRSCQQK